MKRNRFLRLGLFQLAAGALSVLFLGVLNRVMRVELGMDLLTVSILVGGGHYLGALIALPFGYYSDRHPLLGYRRSSYIVLGALVTGAILVSSPAVARWISASPTTGRIIPGFFFFLLEGISTYIAGTAFLSLITDLTDPDQRGQITGWIWTLLMMGIIFTGITAGFVLEPFLISRVRMLFAAAAGIAVLFTLIALWGQEDQHAILPSPPESSLKEAFQDILNSRSARWFGGFLFLSMFSYFMQDVLLEPFGGEVFGLPASETTRFNAYLGVGLVAAMLIGGSRIIPSRGKPWTTSLGIWLMVGAFSGLAASSFLGYPLLLPVVLFILGVGSGFFTVGGVSMMMDMTSEAHTGLFVGAWTLIQAAAKGPTAIAGGLLQTGFVALGFSPGGAYAGVFLVEGLGLLVSLAFLRQVALDEFRTRQISFLQTAGDSLN